VDWIPAPLRPSDLERLQGYVTCHNFRRNHRYAAGPFFLKFCVAFLPVQEPSRSFNHWLKHFLGKKSLLRGFFSSFVIVSCVFVWYMVKYAVMKGVATFFTTAYSFTPRALPIGMGLGPKNLRTPAGRCSSTLLPSVFNDKCTPRDTAFVKFHIDENSDCKARIFAALCKK